MNKDIEMLVRQIKPQQKDFYYKILETRDKEQTCPECGENFKFLWQHVVENVSTHEDFIKKQIEICNELFFNQWYDGKKDVKGFYPGYKFVRHCWQIWYGSKMIYKHGKITNIDFIKENSKYDENFEVDYTKCPICGEECNEKIVMHFWKKWKDEEHQKILFLMIGEILHREKWDENCWYSFDDFYYLTKVLKGTEYVNSHQLREYKKVESKIDWNKIRNEFYYDGHIEIEEECPVCHKKFIKKAIMNHIMRNWKDEKHYNLILRIVGDVIIGRNKKLLSYNMTKEFGDLMTNTLEKSKKIMEEYKPFKKDFYYKKLEKCDTNNICPVCGESKKISIFRHAMMVGHDDFINEQLKICNELFFNQWYNHGNNIKNYYVGETEERELWSKWFGKDVTKRNKIKYANVKEMVKRSYVGDIRFTYICPECGEHCLKNDKKLIMNHILKNWRDEKHYDLLLRLIGDALNRSYWDKECGYSFDIYCYIIRWIKGSKYLSNLKSKNRKSSVRKGNKGFRKDIGFFVNSSWEANVYRIFKYKLGDKWNWVRGEDCEIPFDISEGRKQKTYYVDIYDKYGVFEKDAYIEIKGCYDERAKHKKEMFEKLYSDKKYLMIGVPNGDFKPDINYLDLYEKYENIIPNWEKLNDRFEPESGYRFDVGYAKNYKEANLFRIFRYEYGENWKNYVKVKKFDIKYHDMKIEVIEDKRKLLGEHLIFNENDLFFIDRFKELYDENLVVIDNAMYDELIGRYNLEFETDECNFSNSKKFRQKKKRKTLKQTLGKEYVFSKLKKLDLKFMHGRGNNEITENGKCPACGEALKCSVWQHALTNYDTHEKFLDKQCEMISRLFWDLNFVRESDCSSYGIYVSHHTCCSYWKEIYGNDLYSERQKQVRFTKKMFTL